jgi:hypothetical protein
MSIGEKIWMTINVLVVVYFAFMAGRNYERSYQGGESNG